MYRTFTPLLTYSSHASHFASECNSLQLYTVSSDDFSVHLKVGNYRNGFMNGSTYEHAPIFWSKLFFYDTPADQNWSSRVVLMNPPESLQGDTCETRIGVEPLTGQIMSVTAASRTSRIALTLLQVRAQAHADKFICVWCQRGSLSVHQIQQQNLPRP